MKFTITLRDIKGTKCQTGVESNDKAKLERIVSDLNLKFGYSYYRVERLT